MKPLKLPEFVGPFEWDTHTSLEKMKLLWTYFLFVIQVDKLLQETLMPYFVGHHEGSAGDGDGDDD